MSPVTLTETETVGKMHETKLAEIGDEAVRALVSQSVTARATSHCPYSRFPVGAALLCKNGTVFTGSNIENISFSLTICAERTAVVKAVSEGQTEFEAIAVSAIMGQQLTSPCGACRQVLAEFNPKIKIYLHNPNTHEVGLTTLEELLPHSFTPISVNNSCGNPFTTHVPL